MSSDATLIRYTLIGLFIIFAITAYGEFREGDWFNLTISVIAEIFTIWLIRWMRK